MNNSLHRLKSDYEVAVLTNGFKFREEIQRNNISKNVWIWLYVETTMMLKIVCSIDALLCSYGSIIIELKRHPFSVLGKVRF